MWQRCTNPKHKSYAKYKDRTPPERWKSFENFYEDMGPRPDAKHTVERVKNDEPYGPDNCVWDTRSAQARNMASNVNLTYDGRTMCATDWAKELGISVAVIWRRAKLGWDAEKILTTEIRKKP